MRTSSLAVALVLFAVSAARAEGPTLVRTKQYERSYLFERNRLVTNALLRFTPALRQNQLEAERESDQLRLYGNLAQLDARTGYGVAMFGAITVLTAHAPRSMRVLFDGKLHLGPATFVNGGLGAAVGGKFQL